MASVADHGALMDRIYRWQRPIYDVTRKYYLFGRDRMIRDLRPSPGMAVLEIGCGTGRNLAMVGKRWAGARLYGLDISAEMLCSARKRLSTRATLACGDATQFDARALMGRDEFDRVVLSYALSMIPDWERALAEAAGKLTPGGSLHVVDFGDCAGLPRPFRSILMAWLKRFHVTPRLDLVQAAARVARNQGLTMTQERGSLGYCRFVTLFR